MTFKAMDVMERVATTLQDEDSVRWPAAELHNYLNDGLREIVTLKPNALSTTVNLELVAGTKQVLPATYTVLSRVSRNMTDASTGSTAIRALDSRSIMDSMVPGWQDASIVPNAAKVVHVIHDMADPNVFYVVPGNDGNGMIEAVVGVLPTASPVPASSPGSISSYTDDLDMPDIYMNALVDYLLFRAYSKDARIAGSSARAQAHYQLFRDGVTGFANAEAGMSLATHASTIQQAREG